MQTQTQERERSRIQGVAKAFGLTNPNIGHPSLQSTMEKIWAKELYEMDFREREDINNEIHGVESSRTIRETPEVVSEGLSLLRSYIDKELKLELKLKLELNTNIENGLTPAARNGYERILLSEGDNKVPCVHTKTFLLKFLKACYFDIPEAGIRYFRYIDLSYRIFGDSALKRPPMMTNLTNREQRYLKMGQL